jgi:hypothetical protein
MIKYNKTNIVKLTEYIYNIFGTDLVITESSDDDLGRLPYFLKETYNYWTGKLFDKPLTFIEKKRDESLTPEQYKKQIETIEKAFLQTAIIIIPNIETYNRNRLIQKRVNFIIPGKQCFIPNLFIDLKDYLKIEKQPKSHLQPAAQVLLLYHLQKKSLHQSNYKKLAEILDYPYLTITRAVENLLCFELCKVTDTKEKELILELDRKELWAKALPLLTSPVKKTVFVNDLIPDEYLLKSNITALSHYTEINDSSKEYFAIAHDDFKKLQKDRIVKMSSEYDGDHYVELWKYNPEILSKDRFVDPLSMFLLFKDSKDQRIEIELEKLINRILW